ncbi:MAG: hypothetical protein LBP59_05355, partial [Planctomycetaceae bacterium]|nr:hypothetical protein [Planctomycetaceae bacterium]
MVNKKINDNESQILTDNKRKIINWHEGFVETLEVELRDVGCKFEVTSNVPSTSRSFEIDILIKKIKQTSNDAELTRLGKYLRNYTLCEFKSQNDYIAYHDLCRLS